MRNYLEITPEWLRENEIVGFGEWNAASLYHEESDAFIESVLDDAPDDLHGTIEITAYRLGKVNVDGKQIVETILEKLDEDIGNPDGEAFKATRNMLAAADALAKVIAEEYGPWACEAVETFLVDVPAWIAANRPDWMTSTKS